ncbi:MAG: CvpA family protein [Bacteroidaceae bacterium]|nr:CvpA family protein [Bacteroidaceae bacterium]
MIDLFLIVLLLWALFSGWRNGLIREVVSTVGFLVGLFVAATCYTTLGEYLSVDGSETNQVTSIIAFFILWIIVPIALGFAANLLTRALKGMKLGIPNSMLGAIVSFIKFLILISCILNVMGALNILDESKRKDSALFEPVCNVVRAFLPESDTIGNLSLDDEAAESDTIWVEMNATPDSI